MRLYYRSSGKSMKKYIKRRFFSLRTGARKRKIKFEITYDDLLKLYETQKGKCKLTGIKMNCDYADKTKQFSNLSVDRIDSKTHYHKKNIRLVLSVINRMLWNFDDKDVYYFIKKTLVKNNKI